MGPWEGEEGDEHWGTGLRGLRAQLLPPSSTGAFFIPYFIFFFTCGIPVFFLEVALGQYTSQGSVTAWRKICPLLQGECSLLPSYQGPQGPLSLRHPIPLPLGPPLPSHRLSSRAKCCGRPRKCRQTLGGPKLIDAGEEGIPQERQHKIASETSDEEPWKGSLQVRNPELHLPWLPGKLFLGTWRGPRVHNNSHDDEDDVV